MVSSTKIMIIHLYLISIKMIIPISSIIIRYSIFTEYLMGKPIKFLVRYLHDYKKRFLSKPINKFKV